MGTGGSVERLPGCGVADSVNSYRGAIRCRRTGGEQRTGHFWRRCRHRHRGGRRRYHKDRAAGPNDRDEKYWRLDLRVLLSPDDALLRTPAAAARVRDLAWWQPGPQNVASPAPDAASIRVPGVLGRIETIPKVIIAQGVMWNTPPFDDLRGGSGGQNRFALAIWERSVSA